MRAGNTPQGYGWVTRLLHWVMAVGMIWAIWLGLEAAYGEIGLATLWRFSWHKSIGIAMLGLAMVRIAWHRLSPPPAPSEAGMARWQLWLGRAVHRMFYALMVVMPLVGWVASAATGPDVVVFGQALPRIAPTNEALAAAGFAMHRWLGYLLIATLALHVAGALHRAVWLRDGSLARMLISG